MDTNELYAVVLLGVVALASVAGILYTQLPTGMLAIDCVQVIEPLTGIGRLHCGDDTARSISRNRFPTSMEQHMLITVDDVNYGIFREESVIAASRENVHFSGEDYLARHQIQRAERNV